MDKEKHPPKSAFYFSGSAEFAGGPEEEHAGRFTGIAYSGDVVTGHWYWGAVIFDLSSTKAADRIPALVDHDSSQRAGFAKLNINGDNISAEGVLLKNQYGESVATDGRAGFPWQMSVNIEPSVIDDVQPGASVSVNGRQVFGPAKIFRNNRIREVSFTPVGADPGTSALAMSRNQPENSMDLNEALSKIAELQASNEGYKASAADAEARLNAIGEELLKREKEQRLQEVKSLFSDLGKEFNEAAAEIYIGMQSDVFAAVSADMRNTFASRQRKVPDDELLFNDTATLERSMQEFSSTEKGKVVDIMAGMIANRG